ncbi:hypothetical protein GR157_11540 [Burkholderia sp. 4701]|nr:hypothetical protein [Burkholderia sp. 4701]MXN82446.1 hypothetical protein [Burkholderia sp. 4812]
MATHVQQGAEFAAHSHAEYTEVQVDAVQARELLDRGARRSHCGIRVSSHAAAG